MDPLSELDRYLSMLRHPSGDKASQVDDIVKWFNSLKPSDKADAFIFLLGNYVRMYND